ncbi:hypothetical protein EVAR_72996_1 [Eumeta japonica]|uniref:Uncharacterized protein n=1 Tax=Eumeta variegata TaxID=151549 RepID=A0A4C1SKY6_EUMVA|nr:hypothetical protein EVAR_72996_1 [Eumeta japonica]
MMEAVTGHSQLLAYLNRTGVAEAEGDECRACGEDIIRYWPLLNYGAYAGTSLAHGVSSDLLVNIFMVQTKERTTSLDWLRYHLLGLRAGSFLYRALQKPGIPEQVAEANK